MDSTASGGRAVSRAWITAAFIFFLACCFLGGWVMTALDGAETYPWKRAVERRDAGQ